MSHFVVGRHLPRMISVPLFGDRAKFGLAVRGNDPCWREWQDRSQDFYDVNQKRSIGRIVNNAGYQVMNRVDLSGQQVLEIGPGNLDHISQWTGRPDSYVIVDVDLAMTRRAERRLQEYGVDYETRLLSREDKGVLPFERERFDIIVSFYSLEHLYPLSNHLEEMIRTLKSGGILVGAIPCEGGLAWGLGRALTTRRWLKRHTGINPDKVVCWEHPNFVDHILNTLDRLMRRRYLRYWPMYFPLADLNLITMFLYEKR